ncbi:MAG TPA: pyrimidine dimer DNA glycosylase/endonuclease V [Polyangiaceae bacterium]|nr:pyrimidine dimer DNA glycosylase/endonuclease V [Polyangiaceae bacterium]
MRLWSLHPMHLDAKGLVTQWREGLLARKVLLGLTRGYRNHPQLLRFRATRDPVKAIDSYLSYVLDESARRGYVFDPSKIEYRKRCRMKVTSGQLRYEWEHLKRKLALRDPDWLAQLRSRPSPHPCFRVVPGPIEAFERPKL